MTTAYWLQGGGCDGNTMSLLSSELPDVAELLKVGIAFAS
jgi:Ni,Fe-hydrogenase I small subunit